MNHPEKQLSSVTVTYLTALLTKGKPKEPFLFLNNKHTYILRQIYYTKESKQSSTLLMNSSNRKTILY